MMLAAGSRTRRGAAVAAEAGSYMPQLDTLRFCAVLGVLIAHNWHPARLPWIFGNMDTGFFGVRLFFVLSGFLITGILLDCRELAETGANGRLFFMRQFYFRRFLRIFPVYYLVLVVVLAVNLPPAREIWGWLVTYTSNFYITAHQQWIGRLGHFWTLAVEEQFYLIWPWLVLFVPRRRLPAVLLAVIALGPLYRLYAAVTYPQDMIYGGATRGTLALASFDSLGAGALLALTMRSGQDIKILRQQLTRYWLPAGTAGYLVLHLLFYYGISRVALIAFGDLAAALCFCWLVALASQGFGGRARTVLELRPLTYAGRISYGIYVYHAFLPLLLAGIWAQFGLVYHEPGRLNFILSALGTLLIAALSWHLFEHPINNLKRHFRYDAARIVTKNATGD